MRLPKAERELLAFAKRIKRIRTEGLAQGFSGPMSDAVLIGSFYLSSDTETRQAAMGLESKGLAEILEKKYGNWIVLAS